MKDNLFFWFNNPPKVGKGAFNYVANNWSGKVFYIFLNDFREERKKANWDDGDFGNAIQIKLFECSDKLQTIDNIFEQYPNAIHIINGFKSPIAREVIPRLQNRKLKRAIFMTERPVKMGNLLERCVREIYFNFKYRSIHWQLKSITAGVLALGGLGVKALRKYGWDKELLFPFMYCPPLQSLEFNKRDYFRKSKIKFLYVGRFYYKTKGVDVLLNAITQLKGNFTVDFVGGYGKDADEVKKFIEKHDRLQFLGTWHASEVGAKMQAYDAVVIPTRYDGWNLLVNEAINAGVPVIVTDGAVSDEVVSKYNCGIVVNHSNVAQLAKAMQSVIDNPIQLAEKRSNTKKALSCINELTVGQYLIDIINFKFYNNDKRPSCPWH